MKGIEGGTLVWDHRLDHSFPQPVTSPSLPYLPSRRRCICHCLVPVRLSSRRSYSMYVPSNLYRLILVSYLGFVFRLLHIHQNHNFSSKLSHNTLPSRPPSPIIFSTISRATGLHSTHDHFPLPPCIIIHGRHFMFIHSTLTVPIPRWRNSRGTYLYISHYNITCASFRSCRDWASFEPPTRPHHHRERS